MSKQLLIETKMNALSLQEGVQSKNPHCLGTLRGPCADWGEATRNGNYYSRKLWENVFKDPLVKEALEDRVLLGELDHPQDRLEASASNACIVMTGYEFDDENKVLLGEFDILPTPAGKVLKSLLDCGCKIGVSSRGEGDVTQDSEGRNVVAEDGSYYFVGFDAVAMPAVKKAKPALQESLKRSTFKESISAQISEASTKSELELIKKVLEATESPEVGSLIESIDNKSKELEGTNSSSTLMEDLERSNQKVITLEEENKKLKRDLINSESRVKRFVESSMKRSTEVDELQTSLDKSKTVNKELKSRLSEMLRKTESLEKEVRSLRDKNTELRESLRTNRSTLSESEARVKSLEESLARAQERCRSKVEEAKSLREELQSVKSEYRSRLEESYQDNRQISSSLRQAQKSLKESSSRTQETIKAYAEKLSRDKGVDSKRILESIKPGTTTSDIDKLVNEEVDRVARYRKVPVTNDTLLATLSEGKVSVSTSRPRSTEEDSQTVSFMEQFYHQNK